MSKTILAKDTKINENYLLVLTPKTMYKLTIKKINKIDDDTITSVGVIDERYPGQLHNISPSTSLLEWDEELYNKVKGIRKKEEKKESEIKEESKNNTQVKKQPKEKKMARTVNPRSKVIDKLLSEVEEGNVPNFKLIADKVVEEVGGTEEDKKKISAQARVRHWNFTKGGKVNPFKKS